MLHKKVSSGIFVMLPIPGFLLLSIIHILKTWQWQPVLLSSKQGDKHNSDLKRRPQWTNDWRLILQLRTQTIEEHKEHCRRTNGGYNSVWSIFLLCWKKIKKIIYNGAFNVCRDHARPCGFPCILVRGNCLIAWQVVDRLLKCVTFATCSLLVPLYDADT